MSLCHTCKHRATKTTPPPAHFIVYGCRKKRIAFGDEADWKAGVRQPEKCGEYQQ